MTYRSEPLWRATHQPGAYPALHGDREVDVAIVGGGISGLTAALFLARGGRRVASRHHDVEKGPT